MGGQTKQQFSTKNDATGQKNYFFRKKILLLYISTSRRNFFVCTEISYLQPFSEIMGDQKKRYIERMTNERTTNDERQTIWTIIIPRQDFQNLRANNNLSLRKRLDVYIASLLSLPDTYKVV